MKFGNQTLTFSPQAPWAVGHLHTDRNDGRCARLPPPSTDLQRDGRARHQHSYGALAIHGAARRGGAECHGRWRNPSRR